MTKLCLVRKVNRTLAKNRKLLSELNPHGKSKTSREQMISLSFDFSYFTRIYEAKKVDATTFATTRGTFL